MNKKDFQQLENLQKLYNEMAISEMDLWNTVQSFKSLTASDRTIIQNKLFALEAKKFDPVKIPEPRNLHFDEISLVKYNVDYRRHNPAQSPLITTSNPSAPSPFSAFMANQTIKYYPEENRISVSPETSGDKMFYKIGYVRTISEFDALYEKDTLRTKVYHKSFAEKKKFITFEKHEDGVTFTTYEVFDGDMEKKPTRIRSEELDAILQILIEWKD